MALDPADTIAIHHLYATYNRAADRGDGKAFGGCFTPDGRVDMGGNVSEGFEEIATFADQIPSLIPGSRHIATNIIVEGDGDEATGRAYFMLLDTTKAPVAVSLSGEYEDRLVRTPDGWRFTERRFSFDAPSS